MIRLIITSVLVLSLAFLTGQKTVENYVKEGIALHDDGDYVQAIAMYEKALEVDPKSALVHYEMSLSYYQLRDYKAAVKAADVALKSKEEAMMIPSIMSKGSALDMMGKTKKSIKVFESAIEEMEPHYLLFYNLALNYFKIEEYTKASENCIKAVEVNPGHTSSHFLLANAEARRGRKVPSMLALHYFLMLEPESSRSPDAYALLMHQFGGNVSDDQNKPNTTNIVLSLSGDMEFSAIELAVSLIFAAKNKVNKENKTPDELFVENTKTFFNITGEMIEEKPENIWWTLYVPMFYDIAKSEHIEAYCKYITQSSNEASTQWLEDNQDKLKAFADWFSKGEE